MLVIEGRNVQTVLNSALVYLKDPNCAQLRPSRNGPMLEINQPVTSVYRNPRERVLFDPVRDANPFLHFFESLWMLEGRNDLEFLSQFTKNMSTFSDDGKTLNGAYGYRWRNHFKSDQLVLLLEHLRQDPMSRRAVTQMWDPDTDFPTWSKDHPCNTQILWRLRDRHLDMTVINRSNDAIWGCYGANAVHFSFLQEYVACNLGAKVGSYRQVSNSLHLYPDIPVANRVLKSGGDHVDHYSHTIAPGPLLVGPDDETWFFEADMGRFFESPDGDWQPWSVFFKFVALPMWQSFTAYREQDYDRAIRLAGTCAAPDWRKACVEWLGRRKEGAAK